MAYEVPSSQFTTVGKQYTADGKPRKKRLRKRFKVTALNPRKATGTWRQKKMMAERAPRYLGQGDDERLIWGRPIAATSQAPTSVSDLTEVEINEILGL